MFIAHINPITKEEESVKKHCTDVSEVCSEFGKKIGLAETASLAGLLHDMAKVSSKFQEYIRFCAKNPQDKSLKGSVNHSTGGAKYIYDTFSSGDKYERLAAQLIAMVICSHHSGLFDVIGTDGIDIFNKRINPDKEIFYDECVENFFKECIEVPQIAEQFYRSKDETIDLIARCQDCGIFNSFTLHLVVKFVFSCLIDGDRLQTAIFMSNAEEKHKFKDIHELWSELQLNLEASLEKLKSDSEIIIMRKEELKSDNEIKVLQLRNEISEACKAFGNREPGIYRLYVPTGGGKTLSSLRYALQHVNVKEFNKERIFYIIPFTTIIDQNAEVIKEKILSEKLRGYDIILEHHSNVISDNDDEDYKLLTERWDAPIILTTMVQFLNTLFSGGTQNIRRLHNLTNSVIILDEIQCLPIKCINLLNGALNFLSKLCNATVILCTATQPPLSETAKPLMLSSHMDIIQNIEDKFFHFKRVELVDKCINGGYDTESLADFTLERMKEVDNCLVVLNTKTNARKLFLHIKSLNDLLPQNEKIHLYHLSTSMCPAHRKKVLNGIKEKLGKERVLCISTQLIEAGVDISFQCVIRALAGFDSIIQAAGRCNRHCEAGEYRKVYIINVKDENLSKLHEIRIGKVCSERILNEFKAYPHIYGNELLSPRVIEVYYSFFYKELENEMDYNIKKVNTQMYDLLSRNSKGVNEYNDRYHKEPQYPLKQAFETAASHFKVIDSPTVSVLVPYGDQGKKLIEQINGNCDMKELKSLIKKAQQYTVNLFDYERNIIGSGIYPLLNGGMLALMNEYYNDADLGVSVEGGSSEFLSL